MASAIDPGRARVRDSITLTFAAHAGSTSPFEVRSAIVHESISAPFGVALVCAATDGGLDAEAFVGAPASVGIDRGALGSRVWSGVCTALSALATAETSVNLYAVHLAPLAALLEHKRTHRTFTGKSAPEIAQALLASVGQAVELRLGSTYPALDLRTQRGETDLAFLERVLEDAGISYWFEPHVEQGVTETRAVLADAPERALPAEGSKLPVVDRPDAAAAEPFATDVRASVALRPGALTHGGHDFHRPRFHPTSHAKRGGRGEASLHVATFGVASSATDKGRDAAAEAALAGLRDGRNVTTFTTNVCSFGPGSCVMLAGRGGEFVVTRTKLCWREHAPLEVEVAAAPNTAPVRPTKKAQRARAPSVETAFVDGPAGAEIHADEHGRVQLRFPWDHAASPGSGPWARVDAVSAGAGFGGVALPRVGDEVLVSYLHGDPDAPVVVGRLHNAASPVVHALPYGSTKTGLTTATTGDDASGGHELSFDDRKGSELVRLRSEKDLAKTVKNAEHASVAEHATTIVGGSRTLTVGESETRGVGKLHEIRVAEVKDARIGSAAGPDLVALPTRREIVAQRITMTTGGATIVLDGPDIFVSADKGLRIQAGGVVSIQGEPHVQLNPPAAPPPVDPVAATATPSHVLWFQLHSDGLPLAGVQAHVTADAPEPGSEEVMSRKVETDGNGQVRLSVPGPGTHTVTIAKGSTLVPEGVPVAQVSAQPTPNAKPTSHELPVTIDVVEPKHGALFHLHSEPSMPKVSIEARVTVGGKVVHEGHVGWSFELEGQYRVRSSGGSSFTEQKYKMRAGHAMTAPGERMHFELAPSELLGGELSVQVHFAGGAALGGVRARTRVTGMHVLGKNPPREEVEKYIVEHAGHLAWAYLRLFDWESAHTLGQFAKGSGGGNTPGQPLYGPPSGVGIVQRDPTLDEWRFPKSKRTEPNNFFPRIFWDWRKNLDEGLTSFQETYVARGRADLDALRAAHPHLPPPSHGVLMRASIRRYNGGTEYGVSGDGRHYVVAPVSTNPAYVADVLDDPDIDAHKYPVPADARAHEWP